jgi:hypothetical protein
MCWKIWLRFPGQTRKLSLFQHVLPCSGAHTNSLSVGTGRSRFWNKVAGTWGFYWRGLEWVEIYLYSLHTYPWYKQRLLCLYLYNNNIYMLEILLQNLQYYRRFHSSGIIETPECGFLKSRYAVLKWKKKNLTAKKPFDLLHVHLTSDDIRQVKSRTCN